MVETAIFKIDRSKLFKRIILEECTVWIFIVLLLSVLFLVIGVMVDLRWIVVSLALIAIVLPMMLSFMYISKGMTFENSLNALPHMVRINDNGVEIDLIIKHDGEDEESETEVRKFCYESSSVGRYGIVGDGIYIPLCKKTEGRLYLPYSVFDSKDEFAEAIKILNKYKDL